MPALDTPLVYHPGGGAETYGDALALSGRLANLMVARGVKPGDRVAVQVEKSWTALAVYLAAVRAGAVYLPLNTAYTLAEIEYFLSDAEPPCSCAAGNRGDARALAGRLGVAAVETLGSDGTGSLTVAAEGLPEAFADVPRGRTISAASSTPRAPRAAPRAPCSPMRTCSPMPRTLKDYWRFTAMDVLIHALPIFHTHGCSSPATSSCWRARG